MGLSTVDAFKHIRLGEETIELSGERLRSLQKVLTDMLGDVNSFCDEYEIPYTLGGGTCLGAVRHSGFIPWDDDIDINMTRKGYERFSELFPLRFGDKYWLHDCEKTPGYELAFPRIRLKGTVVRSREDFGNDECGAYIDIFIVENVPSNPAIRLFHGLGSMALGLMYSCRRFAAHAEEYLDLVKDNPSAARVFRKKIRIGKLLSFCSATAWARVWDSWNALCKNEATSYISVPAGRKHYFGELQRREDYFPASCGQFSGMKVPLPADVDVYMKSLYGADYMLLPPVEKRERHVVYEFDLGDKVDAV